MLRAADIELKNLFVEVKDYQLEPEPTKNLIDFCMNHQLSMTNLLLLGIRTYLSKVNNGQEDITIESFISDVPRTMNGHRAAAARLCSRAGR